jgi:competence protein ComEA
MSRTRGPVHRLGWGRSDRLGLTVLVGVWAVFLACVWARRRAPLGPAAAGGRERVQAVRERIDPNTASAASLRRLRLIGPARARAIIDYRRAASKRRPDRPAFETIQDLQRVPGIGAGTVRRIRHQVALGRQGPPETAATTRRLDGAPLGPEPQRRRHHRRRSAGPGHGDG